MIAKFYRAIGVSAVIAAVWTVRVGMSPTGQAEGWRAIAGIASPVLLAGNYDVQNSNSTFSNPPPPPPPPPPPHHNSPPPNAVQG